MLGAASAFIISKTPGVTLRFLGPATRLLSSVCHILSSLKRISGAVDADSLRRRHELQLCKYANRSYVFPCTFRLFFF